MADKTREVVFDNAVIQGQPTAVIQLQRVVGAKQDGFRREAINNAHAIAKRDKSQQKYHKGWINRAEEYQ